MSYSDQFLEDLTAMINTDEFAETIAYKCFGEDSVPATAVINREAFGNEQDGYETKLAKSASLLILASDLPAMPKPVVSDGDNGDLATFDTDADGESIEWVVDNVDPIGAGLAYRVHVTNKYFRGVEV